MPTSPPSLCTVQGCPNLVPYGKCVEHTAEARKESDSKRPNSTERGYDHKWAKARREYLLGHRECEGEACSHIPWYRRPTATDVDHLDGKGPLGPNGYNESNYQALCHSCHSRTTATRDGGFGHPKAHR
jgi:5-methylcytosine-specific restriction protein A